MINHYTVAQLKTPVSKMKLVGNANKLCATAASAEWAQVADPTAGTGQFMFVNDTPNFMRIIPVFATGTTGHAMRIVGWSRSEGMDISSAAHKFWVPTLLADVSVTLGATSTTILTHALFPGISYVKNAGDVGLLSATGTNTNGCVVVDAMGCEIIEVELRAAAGVNCNVFVGGL